MKLVFMTALLKDRQTRERMKNYDHNFGLYPSDRIHAQKTARPLILGVNVDCLASMLGCLMGLSVTFLMGL